MNRLFQISFSFLLAIAIMQLSASDGFAQCGCQGRRVIYSHPMTNQTPSFCRPQMMIMRPARAHRVLRIYRVRRYSAPLSNPATMSPSVHVSPRIDSSMTAQEPSKPMASVETQRNVRKEEPKQKLDLLVAAPEQQKAPERRPPMLKVDQNPDVFQKDESGMVFGITKEQCEAMNQGSTTTNICPATFLDTAAGWDNYSLECSVCRQGAPAAVIYSITDATWGYPAGTEVSLGSDEECNCNCGHK